MCASSKQKALRPVRPMLLVTFPFIFPPLGVTPPAYGLYDNATSLSKNTFSCLDGSGVIPYAQVNDNYPDCCDASDEPGTGVAADSAFYCENEFGTPHEIQGWSVGDGICDCCDGSDEAFNPHADCPLSCAPTEFAKRDLVNRLATLHRRYAVAANRERQKADRIIENVSRLIAPLELRLAKLNHSKKHILQNSALNVTIPTMRRPQGIFSKIILTLWSIIFAAPRRRENEPLTRKHANLMVLAPKINEIQRKLKRASPWAHWNSSIDKGFVPIFRKVYRLGRYKLVLLDSIRADFGVIGRFSRGLGNSQIYVRKFRKGEVEMRIICGSTDRWISITPIGNSSRYQSLFATPVACSNESVSELNTLSHRALNDFALAFEE
jgi:hypothetical protein